MIEKLLNLGEIELINYTGSDLTCVNAARASFGKQVTKLGDKDIILLKRIIDDGHHSTLEHTLFTFRVKAPIFVARQWVRHRMASYNERSGRYCMPEFEFFIPERDDMRGIKEGQAEYIDQVNQACLQAYQTLLHNGCPKEIARTVLPQGLYTNFYFTCNLRSLINFFNLRDSEHAQKEIRVYAKAMKKLIKSIDGNPFKYTLEFIKIV